MGERPRKEPLRNTQALPLSGAPLVVDVVHCGGVVCPDENMSVPQNWKEVPESYEHRKEFQHIYMLQSLLGIPLASDSPALPYCTPAGKEGVRLYNLLPESYPP